MGYWPNTQYAANMGFEATRNTPESTFKSNHLSDQKKKKTLQMPFSFKYR